jgi:signal transduction protein with GAF and PtsI domain
VDWTKLVGIAVTAMAVADQILGFVRALGVPAADVEAEIRRHQDERAKLIEAQRASEWP